MLANKIPARKFGSTDVNGLEHTSTSLGAIEDLETNEKKAEVHHAELM